MSISMFFAIDFVWATNKNMDLSIRFYLVVNNGFFDSIVFVWSCLSAIYDLYGGSSPQKTVTFSDLMVETRMVLPSVSVVP